MICLSRRCMNDFMTASSGATSVYHTPPSIIRTAAQRAGVLARCHLRFPLAADARGRIPVRALSLLDMLPPSCCCCSSLLASPMARTAVCATASRARAASRGGACCVGHMKLRWRSADGLAICDRGVELHVLRSCSWGGSQPDGCSTNALPRAQGGRGKIQKGVRGEVPVKIFAHLHHLHQRSARSRLSCCRFSSPELFTHLHTPFFT